jgi:predicted DCC family thiol-disulfide oxidoreductase YuxK
VDIAFVLKGRFACYALAMATDCGIPTGITTVDLADPLSLLPERPLVLYDGDCGFCGRIVERWLLKSNDRIDVMPYQALGERLPAIDRTECAKAIHLLDNDGLHKGARAVLRIRAHIAGRRPNAAFTSVFGWVLEPGYQVVARNREFFSRMLPTRR